MPQRPDPQALAVDTFRGWLARPAPLDRMLSGRQKSEKWPQDLGKAVWTRLDAMVRFGVLFSAARGRDPHGLTDPQKVRRALLDLGPRELGEAVDGILAGTPPAWLADGKARLEAGGTVERCAAHGVPAWWAPALEARFGDRLGAFLAAQDRRPPLWARLARREDAAKVTESLVRDGLRPTVDPGGFTLRIDGNRAIQGTEAAQSGWIEVQDLASQRAGEAVPLAPGAHVWDACAGAGGKTLLLAGRLAGKGAVYASDVSRDKIEILKKRTVNAAWQNIRTSVWDGTAPRRLPREAEGGFDSVLVDAPCSSSGTWRRNPDAKLRFGPDEGNGLGALQLQLITNAAPAVRPGGALTWATCSWDRAEDEGIVERFVAANPEFTVERSQLLGPPELDSDTLFVSVLRRA